MIRQVQKGIIHRGCAGNAAREILAEFYEMLAPRKRKFLTFIARKPAGTS